MIKDAKKIQTMLHEMVETPSVVRITEEDVKLFREGLIASDCRCPASDPQAFVKVIEQLEKERLDILNVHDGVQKMLIYVYDTQEPCLMMDDMSLLHAFVEKESHIEHKWGLGIWKSDEIRVVVVYQDAVVDFDFFGSTDIGLNQDVWIGTQFPWWAPITLQPQIKVKVGNEKFVYVSIEDAPKVIEGEKELISPQDFKRISDWILLNKQILLDYWKNVFATPTLIRKLKILE